MSARLRKYKNREPVAVPGKQPTTLGSWCISSSSSNNNKQQQHEVEYGRRSVTQKNRNIGLKAHTHTYIYTHTDVAYPQQHMPLLLL